MVPLTGMNKLKILSLGRNLIGKVEFLESVAGTLEELWISYNQLSTLDGINCCSNLTTLYVSNNQIKQWSELDKLQGLANLRDVLFTGNPIYDEVPKEQIRIEVLKRLPQITKIDGDLVKPAERELATGVKME
jgi:dynein light chain 1